MLNRLKIENFKAWREVDLAFGKVTGLFGTNSAGKSSLLQFLLLLKQTRNATDRRLVPRCSRTTVFRCGVRSNSAARTCSRG